MDIDLIFKIAAVGILTAVFHTVLKQAGKEEQGQLVTLAGVTIVLLLIVPIIGDLFDKVRSVFQLY
ncbi:MAG: stage III sporulation protein AC [Bacillota bacterium]|nr:stage III sporulation protein AC [Bacillota bacterium]